MFGFISSIFGSDNYSIEKKKITEAFVKLANEAEKNMIDVFSIAVEGENNALIGVSTEGNYSALGDHPLDIISEWE
jgi:hypothetical protein